MPQWRSNYGHNWEQVTDGHKTSLVYIAIFSFLTLMHSKVARRISLHKVRLWIFFCCSMYANSCRSHSLNLASVISTRCLCRTHVSVSEPEDDLVRWKHAVNSKIKFVCTDIHNRFFISSKSIIHAKYGVAKPVTLQNFASSQFI
jgi:hypothetical protein